MSADASQFVSGVVVGASGIQLDSGDFEVHELIVPGFPPQAPIRRTDNPRYIALVSGLNVGGSHQNPLLPQLMADYLAGLLSAPTEQENLVASVARLVSDTALDL